MAATWEVDVNGLDRSNVLVLGEKQFDESQFIQRRLKITRVNVPDLLDENLLNTARGVLLATWPGKFPLIKELFYNHFERMCERGLLTAVLEEENKAQLIAIRNEVYSKLNLGKNFGDPGKQEEFFDQVPWVYVSEQAWQIAETLARHDPGPKLGSPTIIVTGNPATLDAKCEILLRRGFHDCKKIIIEHLRGGKTAKDTLRVHAEFEGHEYGPQPIPFFVKFGDPETIAYEKLQYQKLVEPFIPFHLRPALSEIRSFTALNCAALVCNFVENAISLRDALKAGHGDGAIYSLFEVTLRGLRSHTLHAPKRLGSLAPFFNLEKGRVRAAELRRQFPERIEKLHALGVSQEPEDMEKSLVDLVQSIESRDGPYHGDPHVGNIMVRNRDAIVIDFGSMGPYGPLSADPAILEVSLVFGTDNGDDPKSFAEWRNFVDYIYDKPLAPPLPNSNFHQFNWLYKAVREVRHVVSCCGVGEIEALMVLAGCLIRFGRHSVLQMQNAELDDLATSRRIYALVVADSVCRRLKEYNASR